MSTAYVHPKDRLEGFNGYCGVVFDTISDEHCIIRCDLTKELRNPSGMAHGGLVATLMDVAAGTIAIQNDRAQHAIVTQSCDIHFLRPGLGSGLRAVSSVIRKGRRVCVTQVECFDEDDDKLVAYGVYEVAYLDMPYRFNFQNEQPDHS